MLKLSIKQNHTCAFCCKPFVASVNAEASARYRGSKLRFCTRECNRGHLRKQRILSMVEFNCANCEKLLKRTQRAIRKSKTGRFFCSKSCSATYNNVNKQHGTRRSKLEVWLELQLRNKFPEHNLLFNDKTTIGSELDIVSPALNLAIEINGIYHYKPIHGKHKLEQIKANDHRKHLACKKANIVLHTLDVSTLTRFTKKSSISVLTEVFSLIGAMES